MKAPQGFFIYFGECIAKEDVQNLILMKNK